MNIYKVDGSDTNILLANAIPCEKGYELFITGDDCASGYVDLNGYVYLYGPNGKDISVGDLLVDEDGIYVLINDDDLTIPLEPGVIIHRGLRAYLISYIDDKEEIVAWCDDEEADKCLAGYYLLSQIGRMAFAHASDLQQTPNDLSSQTGRKSSANTRILPWPIVVMFWMLAILFVVNCFVFLSAFF